MSCRDPRTQTGRTTGASERVIGLTADRKWGEIKEFRKAHELESEPKKHRVWYVQRGCTPAHTTWAPVCYMGWNTGNTCAKTTAIRNITVKRGLDSPGILWDSGQRKWRVYIVKLSFTMIQCQKFLLDDGSKNKKNNVTHILGTTSSDLAFFRSWTFRFRNCAQTQLAKVPFLWPVTTHLAIAKKIRTLHAMELKQWDISTEGRGPPDPSALNLPMTECHITALNAGSGRGGSRKVKGNHLFRMNCVGDLDNFGETDKNRPLYDVDSLREMLCKSHSELNGFKRENTSLITRQEYGNTAKKTSWNMQSLEDIKQGINDLEFLSSGRPMSLTDLHVTNQR